MKRILIRFAVTDDEIATLIANAHAEETSPVAVLRFHKRLEHALRVEFPFAPSTTWRVVATRCADARDAVGPEDRSRRGLVYFVYFTVTDDEIATLLTNVHDEIATLITNVHAKEALPVAVLRFHERLKHALRVEFPFAPSTTWRVDYMELP